MGEIALDKLFDKIYVLTIDRNFDRHPAVNTLLENTGFEFWNGFDAGVNFPLNKYVSEIDESFFVQHNVERAFAISSTLGQFGAYLSIKKMIDHIAASGYDKVLIFEDDAMATRTNWKEILNTSLKQLPVDWDILMAGYFYDGGLYKYAYDRKARPFIHLYNAFRTAYKKKKYIKKMPARFSMHLDKAGYSTGGHAFCLSAKGARLLSGYLNPMRDSGDLLFSRLITEQKINAFAVYPCLFLQNPEFGSKTEV